jgi:hypothetical protein
MHGQQFFLDILSNSARPFVDIVKAGDRPTENHYVDSHATVFVKILRDTGLKAGERFEPGKGYADIIGDFDVQFRPMHPSHYWDG